jgi:hypothetical protein
MQNDQGNNIQASFDITLKDTDLENLAVDVAELTIDNVLDDGLLKDIPIVRTLVNLSKLGANIHDKLFLKKILSFLNGLKDVSVEDRNKMIKDIDESKEHRVKVGEKLFYIIDSCNDFENSERVANVFKAFVGGKISYNDFLATSNILEKISNHDFKWFVKNAKNYMSVESVGSLISSGLFDLYYNSVDVRVMDEDDHKTLQEGGDKYKADVEGGDINVNISRAGEVIMELFNPEYIKPKVVKIS